MFFFFLMFGYFSTASQIAQLIKRNLLQCRRLQFNSWIRKIHWRRDKLPTPVFLGFPCGSAGKEFTCNVGDMGLILRLGRSPGEGTGYPLQYSGLENFLDSIVHGVTKSWTQLSVTFTFISQHIQSIGVCCKYSDLTERFEIKEFRAVGVLVGSQGSLETTGE